MVTGHGGVGSLKKMPRCESRPGYLNGAPAANPDSDRVMLTVQSKGPQSWRGCVGDGELATQRREDQTHTGLVWLHSKQDHATQTQVGVSWVGVEPHLPSVTPWLPPHHSQLRWSKENLVGDEAKSQTSGTGGAPTCTALSEPQSPWDRPTWWGGNRWCLDSEKWVSARFSMGKGREMDLDLGDWGDGPTPWASVVVSTSEHVVRSISVLVHPRHRNSRRILSIMGHLTWRRGGTFGTWQPQWAFRATSSSNRRSCQTEPLAEGGPLHTGSAFFSSGLPPPRQGCQIPPPGKAAISFLMVLRAVSKPNPRPRRPCDPCACSGYQLRLKDSQYGSGVLTLPFQMEMAYSRT